MAKKTKPKDVKVVWVDSWREIPRGGRTSSTRGYYDPNTNRIYAIKGITTQADIEHETYHGIMGHEGTPTSPEMFARQEFEAHKYAYDKIKTPRNVLQVLRGVFSDMGGKYYDIGPHRGMAILEAEFNRVNPPESWKEDFGKLKVEFENKFGKLRGDASLDWWEGKYYQDNTVSIKYKKGKSVSHNNSLLPPQIGGEL